MITVTEGVAARNKALYGLAIAVTFSEGESVESDFYPIKDALLSWQRSRGKACGALTIEYEVPLFRRKEIEDFWLRKFEHDQSIQSLFASFGEVQVSMLTPDGRDIKSIGFQAGGQI